MSDFDAAPGRAFGGVVQPLLEDMRKRSVVCGDEALELLQPVLNEDEMLAR